MNEIAICQGIRTGDLLTIMSQEMHLRKKLYTPIWRDPKYLRIQERDRKLAPILAWLTVACLAFLLLPPGLRYGEAISFQLAEGAVTAQLLFGMMFVTLIYLGLRLAFWQQYLGALATLLMTGALSIIALTDPLSSTHNGVFILLCLMLCTGHVGVFCVHGDAKLLLTAVVALAGLVICKFSLGTGERMLVGSTCLALNVLYYDYLDV